MYKYDLGVNTRESIFVEWNIHHRPFNNNTETGGQSKGKDLVFRILGDEPVEIPSVKSSG